MSCAGCRESACARTRRRPPCGSAPCSPIECGVPAGRREVDHARGRTRRRRAGSARRCNARRLRAICMALLRDGRHRCRHRRSSCGRSRACFRWCPIRRRRAATGSAVMAPERSITSSSCARQLAEDEQAMRELFGLFRDSRELAGRAVDRDATPLGLQANRRNLEVAIDVAGGAGPAGPAAHGRRPRHRCRGDASVSQHQKDSTMTGHSSPALRRRRPCRPRRAVHAEAGREPDVLHARLSVFTSRGARATPSTFVRGATTSGTRSS